MKMLLRIKTILLILLLPAGLNASTNELLYKWCKSYVDQGFEIQSETDAYCIGFFDGIGSLAADICTLARKTQESSLYFFSIDRTKYSKDAAIQQYVNTVKGKPDKWQNGAHGDVLRAQKTIAPCE